MLSLRRELGLRIRRGLLLEVWSSIWLQTTHIPIYTLKYSNGSKKHTVNKYKRLIVQPIDIGMTANFNVTVQDLQDPCLVSNSSKDPLVNRFLSDANVTFQGLHDKTFHHLKSPVVV